MKVSDVILIMIGMNSAVFAQTAAPATTNPPGITQGPWTSQKASKSTTQCGPGEYVMGIEVETGVRGCAGCISRLRVICRRYGI